MEAFSPTTALAAALVVSAAMILLGLSTHRLVWRIRVCPACRADRRACRCRRGS